MSSAVPDWIRDALSVEQLKPLEAKYPNVCILAGAGSGKTRTIVNLIAYDLMTGVSPNEIVAFTFTEKAAAELLARVHSLLHKHNDKFSLEGIYIGTIHAWCHAYILEQNEFYNFDVLDELHVDALASRVYDELGLESIYKKLYPKGIDDFLKDLEIFYNENLMLEALPEKIRPAISRFTSILEQNRLLTFGDMIRHAIGHLDKNGPIENLKRLYIDEYQDVNPSQVKLAKVMLPPSGKLRVVGDDLQCIYNWRGSDVNRILNFKENFKGSKTFRLETNHRARPQLLTFANTVAENISLRDEEKILKDARSAASTKCVLWNSSPSEEHQANEVAESVINFMSNGVPANKIAILLRSVLRSGPPILNELINRGIQVECPQLNRSGGFINTFLLPILDWLRHSHEDPHSEEAEEEQLKENEKLWETCEPCMQSSLDMQDVFWDGLHAWLELIEAKHSKAYDVRGCLYEFLDLCNIRTEPQGRSLLLGLGIATQIIRSVEEIHRRRLRGRKRRTPKGVINEVFFALVRNSETFGDSMPIDTSVEAVALTTIHQSKGLEWPVVILPTIMPRRFPVRSSKHGTSFEDDIASRYGTTVEDEWRLFYVASTRARERLLLLDFADGNVEKSSQFLRKLFADKIIVPGNIPQQASNVWRIDLEELKHSDTPPVRLGVTDLLLHIECPYQYALRRVIGIQPSVSDELGYGKSLHELIQRRCEAGGPWNHDELNKQVEQFVHVPYMSEKGAQTAQKAIKNRISMLESYDAFSGEILSEIKIDQPIRGGLIQGAVDCIQKQDNQKLTLRDWKTNIHESLLPRYKRQLQFYTYALSNREIEINKAEMIDVGDSKTQGKLVACEVDISSDALASVVDEANMAVQQIKNGEFTPKPNLCTCSCCDMFKICSLREEK